MKTKRQLFLYIVLSVTSISFCQKISEIDFIGLKNVKKKEAMTFVKTKKGSIFSKENVSNDIQNLLNSGYFETVEAKFDQETKKLIFIVEERPLIKKIEFRGNKKISTSKLKEEIVLKEKEFLDELKLNESKDKIYSLYDEKGYVDTIVEVEKFVNEKNFAHIIFLITEGKKVVVEKIEIVGNKKFSKRKILSLMETKRKKVFRENKLKSDIEKIVEFYKNEGFYDVVVSTSEIKYNEEKLTVDIVINIDEGKIYRISEIKFEGNTVYSTKQLEKIIQIKKGMIYNKEKIDNSVQSIAELYADKGYLAVNITPEIKKVPETGKMEITFDIVENNQFYVEKIYIDGLTSTKEEVIKREILLKEGDLFSSSKLRRSMERIYNLGFLDDVKVNFEPGGNPNGVDIVFNLTEGKPGMLSAGAGFSSVDKLVGNLQVSHLNLFGRAQRLNLMWEFGERRQNYSISWTEPWFLSKPVSLGISIYNLDRLRDYSVYTNAYWELRQGFELRLGPRISDIFSLVFSYSYENVQIHDVKDIQEVREAIKESKKITSSLSFETIYDTRDNIFDTTRGQRASLTTQFAGIGGDVRFIKLVPKYSMFIPTFWKFVFSFNIVFGYIEGISGYDLNEVKYEKFYVGGAETVRGYGYRELAPADGGRIFFVFNTEYKFPLVQENRRTVLQGALFYDVGAAWERFEDVNFKIGDTDQWREGKWDNMLKHSVGFGIRFTIPAFPIRLDWSWPLNPRPFREGMQFWFTIGQVF